MSSPLKLFTLSEFDAISAIKYYEMELLLFASPTQIFQEKMQTENAELLIFPFPFVLHVRKYYKENIRQKKLGSRQLLVFCFCSEAAIVKSNQC